MSGPDDIATPDGADEVGTFEGPPREVDVAAEISKGSRRAWLIGAGALLVVALVVGLLMAGGDDGATTQGDGDDTAVATSTPDGSLAATSSYADTATVDGDRGDDEGSAHGGGDPGDDGDADVEDGTVAFIDAGLVAFRLGEEVWVAKADGTGREYVATCPVGEFALSPDGTQLAIVDCDEETLRLVQTDSGSYVEAGVADPLTPVWSPSSAWVLTERGDEVWLISAHEERSEFLAKGRALAVRDDAQALLITPGHDARHLTVVTFDGPDVDVVDVETEGHPSYAAWRGDDLYHVSRMPETGLTRIMRGSADDPDAEVLVEPLHGVGHLVGYTHLMLSPDGEWLAFAASGDDGYSRLYVVSTDGGTPKELSIRRDAYPLRWSADGDFVLFIEGNAFQGEGTRLMRVRPDGMGRETLIEDAGL